MNLETGQNKIRAPKVKRSASLATSFRDVIASGTPDHLVFKNLEENLAENSFVLAPQELIKSIFESNTLLTRSEQFSKVIDLLEGKPIELINEDNHANMCTLSSGSGFTIAMNEGFSGDDVGNMVKTVITFRGEHLTSRKSIPPENDLWRTKPSTAQVSLASEGTIMPEDIEVVSFRFPIHLFPENLLTEREQEELDAERITFVVRHYIPIQRKTTH